MFEKENRSSERDVLSRRNAAVAMRRPVWRRTTASSIRPKWQQAWPNIKYLVKNNKFKAVSVPDGDGSPQLKYFDNFWGGLEIWQVWYNISFLFWGEAQCESENLAEVLSWILQ